MDKKNNQNDNPNKKKNIKSAIILLVVCLGITALFTSVMSRYKNGSQKKISYSKFLTMSDKGEIKKVQVADRKIYIEPKTQQNPLMKTTYYTVSMNDALLVNRLKEAEDNNKISSYEQQDSSGSNAILSVMVSYVLPFVLIYAMMYFVMRGIGKGGGMMGSVGKSNAKVYVEKKTGVTFADVAGIPEAKVELEEVVSFLKEPEKFKKIGAKIPKGVLLLGGPGTGKTLLAKAVAGEAKVPFFSMSGSEFVEMFVGVGASRVRDLFNKARKSAPCIIFIDEIDAVGRKRGSGQGGGNDEREQTLNQLLVEMDGFGTDETIIVLAATNRPEILDKALMRPGRFDRQVVVDNPDIKGREEILKVHARGKKLAKDVDLSVIAKKTPGFVGADLANMLNEAAILAARAGRDEINMADLEEASEKVSIGPERKSKVVIEKERLITAYHEAGHALMHYLLPNTDPVHKITIVPRGMAGGFTMALPEEERSYKFKSEFLDDMRVLFGGRAAEQIVFNDITTGASNDIERATAIAHALVTRFGMTNKFGPMLLDNTKEGDLFQQKYYSDTTGKEVDDEIRGIISEMYAETIKMLQENYDSLDRVAKALLEKETLNREDFEAIMRGEDIFKSKENSDEKIESAEEVETEKEEIVEKIEEEKNIEEKVEEEK